MARPDNPRFVAAVASLTLLIGCSENSPKPLPQTTTSTSSAPSMPEVITSQIPLCEQALALKRPTTSSVRPGSTLSLEEGYTVETFRDGSWYAKTSLQDSLSTDTHEGVERILTVEGLTFRQITPGAKAAFFGIKGCVYVVAAAPLNMDGTAAGAIVTALPTR